MKKVELKPKTYLYPMPTVIIGANVEGKPNFATVAYCGIVNHSPPMISVSLAKEHHTNIGIRANKTFSVNIPSSNMAKVTDYIGTYSGRKIDKTSLFEVFYGKLKDVPLINECPINLECRVIDTLEYPMDEVFIGEIVNAYAGEEYLNGDLPDIRKIDPIIFSMHDNNYWKLGEHIGQAWKIGLDEPTSQMIKSESYK